MRTTTAAHGGHFNAPDAAVNDDALKWYLGRVGTQSLLNATEEVQLSKAVQKLSRWEAQRDLLEATLLRKPSAGEWAAAVGFTPTEIMLDAASNHAARERPAAAKSAGERAQRSAVGAVDSGGSSSHASGEGGVRVGVMSSCSATAASFEQQLQLLRQAREAMITHNLKLVVSIAKRYANRGVNLQDLIQEGTFGLITAVEKFDPAHTCRFVTYAHYWIHLSVARAVSTSSRLIRLPVHMGDTVSRIKRVRGAFYNMHGRLPTQDELATEAKLKPAKLELALSASRGLVSLEAQRSAAHGARSRSDERTWAEMIPDTGPRPDDRLEETLRTQVVNRLLHSLEPREGQVVRMLYALDGGGKRTTREVASTFGTSPDRVRTIQARALRKLRRKPHLKELLLDLDK